jgi:hypothetical protein
MADTAVSEALIHADGMFNSAAGSCRRQVIDVSGDGIANAGAQVAPIAQLIGTEDNVSGVIIRTDLVGNGFGTTMIITDCVGFATCTSENTIIGGALYGPDADNLAGVILLDATFTDDAGNIAQLVGPGTFNVEP